MQTITEFLRKHPVTMTCRRVEESPNLDPSDTWSQRATHWKCTLSHQGESRSVFFSQGPAHRNPPTLRDVLDCIASDSADLDQPFEEWAKGLGYDPDSRKAYRIYTVCVVQAENLESLLGKDVFRELVYHTERC